MARGAAGSSALQPSAASAKACARPWDPASLGWMPSPDIHSGCAADEVGPAQDPDVGAARTRRGRAPRSSRSASRRRVSGRTTSTHTTQRCGAERRRGSGAPTPRGRWPTGSLVPELTMHDGRHRASACSSFLRRRRASSGRPRPGRRRSGRAAGRRATGRRRARASRRARGWPADGGERGASVAASVASAGAAAAGREADPDGSGGASRRAGRRPAAGALAGAGQRDRAGACRARARPRSTAATAAGHGARRRAAAPAPRRRGGREGTRAGPERALVVVRPATTGCGAVMSSGCSRRGGQRRRDRRPRPASP